MSAPAPIRPGYDRQARRTLQARIAELHFANYPYPGVRPTPAQIEAVLGAVISMVRTEHRPDVLAALGLEDWR